jgi:hypothetical protein
MKTVELSPRIRDIAAAVLAQEFGSHLTDVSVHVALDHQDEEALFFEMALGPEAPIDIGRQFVAAHLKLLERLVEEGEFRFPYLRTRRAVESYPDEFILKARIGSLAKRGRRRA